MDDCFQTGKPSRYIANTKDNSTVHFSLAGVKAGRVHLRLVAGDMFRALRWGFLLVKLHVTCDMEL